MNKFVQQLISYAMVALNLEYDQRKFNNTKICRKNKRRYFVITKKKKKIHEHTGVAKTRISKEF